MSKIPLSYRIIKNCNITCHDEDRSFIDTKIDYHHQENILSLVTREKEEYDETINLDEIRNQIRRELSIEVENERQHIISTAKEEAEDAKQKAIKQGYKDGYEQGYEQGLQEAHVEGRTIKNNAILIMEQAERYVSEYYIENRVNIIKLAANMAESIVHATIDTSAENITMLIKPILQKYGKNQNIIITCHPNNSVYLKENLCSIEEICPTAKFIILEDKNLEENGCIIENEHQIVDLQVKKQIENILEEMKNLE